MSIDHLKKQAKNLKRLWPEFATSHGEAPSLAACQELIARCSGYASWHAAVSAKKASGEKLGEQPLARDANATLKWDVHLYSDSFELGEEELPAARFVRIPSEIVEAQEDELYDFEERAMQMVGPGGRQGLNSKAALELVALCDKLLSQNPLLMDAYASKASALSALGRHEEAIEAGRAAFDSASKLLPATDGLRVSYYELANRPFHRLAFAVAEASLKVGDALNKERGKIIAESMLKWWPNDNMGFRFLLGKRR